MMAFDERLAVNRRGRGRGKSGCQKARADQMPREGGQGFEFHGIFVEAIVVKLAEG